MGGPVGDPRTHDCRLSTLTGLTCSEAGQLSSQLVKKMSRDTLTHIQKRGCGPTLKK